MKVVVGSKNYLQRLYCFESFDSFVTMVCTDHYNEPDQALVDIMTSLEIPENKHVITLLPEVVLE